MCPMIFTTRKHIRMHLSKGKCNVDRNITSSNLHKVQSGSLNYGCNECGQIFNIKANLERHKGELHTNSEIFHCVFPCTANFGRKRTLDNHQNGKQCKFYQSKYFNFECPNCGKKF